MAERKKVITPVFRVCFPTLAAPKAMKDDSGNEGKAKFGLTAVWTPARFTEADKKRWANMLAILDEAAKEKFKKPYKQLDPEAFKKGLRNGANKSLEGFGEGTIFANLTTSIKPGIVDRDGNEIDPTEVYAGCYCRATVNAYAYDNKGKGVALGLMNVQKVADGPRLDGRSHASEDFSEDDDMGWLEGQTEALDEEQPF